MNYGFLQVVGFIDYETHVGSPHVVPGYFVLFDGGLLGTAAMFGGGGGREVPFYIGGSGDKRDVVEVDYLRSLASVRDFNG
jgi:hypothetical protein